jgi:hypothetical protein
LIESHITVKNLPLLLLVVDLGPLAVGSVERKVPSQNPKKVKNKSCSPPLWGRRR